ncbi:5-oxoprolinase subunit PxpB [Robertmurraya yapensis]|uniref:5-oxoprolinase subunit PxpB n=2 Tax=Bacillaceae TaxID=186817 RepID=A0A3S0RFE9_9BACI|nr:5-oxoprolinase subunit PxpB [Bacillus yapensis]RTR27110.1 5-oxoprolinase subunit PxpB [Bacillus yapensis]TKS93957.1 5-oxoprolinase subunit PxpB [Bacillus yapensis]
MDLQFYPLGDQAVILEFGNIINPTIHKQIQVVSNYIEENPPDWMIEFTTAFTTITVFYNPEVLFYKEVCQELSHLLKNIKWDEPNEYRMIEIPVCYGGDFGPDLIEVAKTNGLTTDEVIDIHAKGEYIVYMIGFAPGFPYLGGMSEKIATPRKATPRLKIPARSVGIAGTQTGVYPIETPGGWQLIGKTPLELFLPNQEVPSLLRAGDRVHFTPISLDQYMEMEQTRS